ncbi:MAG: septum formation initiator family protein [Patescibacteria group bacterium]
MDRHSLLRSWPWVTIGAALFVIFLAAATVRQGYQGWKVDQEIKALEAEANALEGRNHQLVQLAQNLQTSDRLDLEARKRLGMQQPGEHVVVMEGYAATGTWDSSVDLSGGVSAGTDQGSSPTASNPERWFEYFFKK